MPESAQPTVMLVHGAFADASGFGGVIRELSTSGYRVFAPPDPLRSLVGDAATVSAVAGAIDGPVVLVGHSYGGAVITQASASLDNVVGLVYLAAFSLDLGESCASVQAPFPPSMLAATAEPTPYDAPGAVDGPDLFIGEGQFRETFCADVPVDLAQVMYATQRPPRSPPSPRTPPRPGGRPSVPGTWSPATTTRSRRRPSGSWPSGWARPPRRSTGRTPPSSPSPCARRNSSRPRSASTDPASPDHSPIR